MDESLPSPLCLGDDDGLLNMKLLPSQEMETTSRDKREKHTESHLSDALSPSHFNSKRSKPSLIPSHFNSKRLSQLIGRRDFDF
ncbi:hypothetical protein LSTR_LSTR014019 [Laodelphax striatellus]|uniref:Uncharacterized protein n=1 Tax=Laodelphax striatellus TaxID=195883 RepID=A0A482WUR6_LAOST|nr:hypothetical protein LSTR_LSTR014019 [Laodelphax striatellus]